MLILRCHGRSCHIIHSCEGVIGEAMRKAEPLVVQPWFADDNIMTGPSKRVATAMELLERLGPARGYFPEPAKNIIVVCQESQVDPDQALRTLELFDFQYSNGHRYVGSFIGSNTARSKWLTPKIQKWVYGVNRLAKVACRDPQTSCTGMAKSLQSE